MAARALIRMAYRSLSKKDALTNYAPGGRLATWRSSVGKSTLRPLAGIASSSDRGREPTVGEWAARSEN